MFIFYKFRPFVYITRVLSIEKYSDVYRACLFFTNLDLLYRQRVRYLSKNALMYTAHVYFLEI
jgi:hypothetical protein